MYHQDFMHSYVMSYTNIAWQCMTLHGYGINVSIYTGNQYDIALIPIIPLRN